MGKKLYSAILIICTLIYTIIMFYNNYSLKGYDKITDENIKVSQVTNGNKFNEEVKVESYKYIMHKIPKEVILQKANDEFEKIKIDRSNYFYNLHPEKINEYSMSSDDKDSILKVSKKLSKNDYDKIQQYLNISDNESIIMAINLLRDRLSDKDFNIIKNIANKNKTIKWCIKYYRFML